jgi:crotonobetainyl-CoA:carnitine CoA-transferase CaiB-like acyl-CoA transferase
MTAAQPLKGLKVVELSNMVTASLAAMTLGQQGTDVIKVEPLGIGDKLRHFGSQKAGISGVFHNCNRGKKSLAINLKSAQGQAAVRKLALGADVLIHNYRPGVMSKLGLNSAELRAENPKLIVCSLTGFGRQGPLKDAPAFDHVIQALSGITGAQGQDGALSFVRMLICDKITAYTAAQAVTAALVHQARTGQGQHIDISMLQASLAFMWPDGMMHKTLLADDALHLAPMADYYQTFETTDGFVAAAPFGDAEWQAVFKIIDRPDLAADPRFATLQSRGKHVAALLKVFADAPLSLSTAEVLKALSDADIACAPCLSLDELSEHDQIKAVQAIETQTHPHLGEVQMAAAPVQFEGQPQTPLGPSPLLGEHSAEILRAQDYSEAEISEMQAAKII